MAAAAGFSTASGPTNSLCSVRRRWWFRPISRSLPPAPGAPRPSEGTASEQALDALFGGPAPRSRVEASVIDRAGAAAPSIRSQVGDTETNTVAKGRVTRDIIAAPEGDGQAATTVIPSA